MTFYKLSALALATTLALTGCGSDDSSSSHKHGNGGSGDVPSSEIDQAKEMISTAKLFVNDGYAVKAAYEDTSKLLTSQQSARFNYIFDVPGDLYEYMLDKGLSQLTGAQINAMATTDVEFNNALGNYKLTPESDFIATVDANKHFKLSGSTLVKVKEMEYGYNPTTQKWEDMVAFTDNYKVKFAGFENNAASQANTTTHMGNITFDTIEFGTGSELVKLSAGDNGVKAVADFEKAVSLDDTIGLDLNELMDQGIMLNKAVYSLDSLKLEANDAVIEAKNFEFAALNIVNTLANGTKMHRVLPYSVKLTGVINKQTPKTDATITLNAVANEAEAKNYITLNDADKFVEAQNKYVGMTALLSIKGDVTKEGSTTIPLDFQANLKRSARDVIVLDKLTANVEGKTLYVTGQTDLDANYNATGTTLMVKQNDAHVTFKMDAEGEFIKDSNNKLADIMVGDTDYGDLYDNNSRVTAFFTDNTTELL